MHLTGTTALATGANRGLGGQLLDVRPTWFSGPKAHERALDGR